MISKHQHETPLTDRDRREFYASRLGWGLFGPETRLVFVGTRDGGPSWTEGTTHESADADIHRMRQTADTRTVPGFHICRSGAHKLGITERQQCHFSMELRRRMGMPFVANRVAQYYYPALCRGFELVANVLPLARPNEDSPFPEALLRYLGFADAREAECFSERTLERRLQGISGLLAALKRQRAPCVMLLMGSTHRAEVCAALDLRSPESLPVLQSVQEVQRPAVFFQDNVAVCVTGHPAARGKQRPRGLDEAVSDALAQALGPFLGA